jgi:tripartite-type tricarboxylate transporter receptor subunit TctC
MTHSVLAGFTPIACGAIGNSVPLIKEGKIRVLAITSNKRLATLPDVATLDELGFKNQEAETMTGVFVPAGTPRPAAEGNFNDCPNAGCHGATSGVRRYTGGR